LNLLWLVVEQLVFKFKKARRGGKCLARLSNTLLLSINAIPFTSNTRAYQYIITYDLSYAPSPDPVLTSTNCVTFLPGVCRPWLFHTPGLVSHAREGYLHAAFSAIDARHRKLAASRKRDRIKHTEDTAAATIQYVRKDRANAERTSICRGSGL
jgi:hypothetical protein